MPESQGRVVRATATIVVSSLGFGSLSTLTLLAEHAGLSLLTAMLWRYLLAVVVLIAFLRGAARAIEPKRALQMMIIGGVGQALITYLSLMALDYLPVGPLAFLFYTYPAWVAVVSAIAGKERLTVRRLIALAIAMAGITVMVGAPGKEHLNRTGVFLALGIAFFYALYLPALHKVQAGIKADVATLYLLVGVLLSFVIASLVTSSAAVPQSFDQWKYVFILAIICTVMAFSALIMGLRVLGPVRTSIISTIEPFFTAILGVVLLRQPLASGTLLGGALVAAAVVILQLAGAAPESDAARL
jgi:drug/metabolite transporter (DMT)-like permease